MNLLAIERSCVTSLFDRTRPRGQLYLPHATSQISERYGFFGAPRKIEDFEARRLEFRHGIFDGSAIEALDLYDDGIVVSSRSDTDLIEQFLDDFINWMEGHLNLSIIKTHTVERIFESILIVESDVDVFRPLEAYEGVARLIEKALQASSNLGVPYHKFSLALSADQTQNPALKPVPFRFERRLGVEFSRNQFYTAAPVRTKQHLEILEALEQVA